MNKIVVLSHQGGSFIEKITKSAAAIDLQTIIISSKGDLSVWREKYAGSPENTMFDELDLSFNQVKWHIDEHVDANSIVGFISVWVGYRPLMAALNGAFGFIDISENVAKSLRDKFLVRKCLKDANISRVSADIANKESIQTRLMQAKQSFLKPRFGLGSAGTKILTSIEDLDYIDNIRKEIKGDDLLSNAFKSVDFIVEDYIDVTWSNFLVQPS
jgi:biotin carboxylase